MKFIIPEKIKVLTVQFLKELGRVIVAAVIPVVLAYTQALTPELSVLLFGVIKATDKGTVKAGVLKRGLIRF